MFDRSHALTSVHSGYLTAGQLLVLAAHLCEWAPNYLDGDHTTVLPSRLGKLDDAPFRHNPRTNNTVRSEAWAYSADGYTSSSDS